MRAHKQPPMIDSDVIIDAIDGAGGSSSDDACAAVELLKSCERFAVSAITTFEMLHTTDEHQRKAYEDMRFDEYPVTWPVSKLAANIANHAREAGQICERCWAMLPPRTCGHCNSQVARQQRINDIMIVATAEVNRVPFLYTRDSGMRELGKLPFFKYTSIVEPPAAAPQLPLLPDNTVRMDPARKKRHKS
jgi:predicted nucleic acid-binding protein